MLGLVKQMVKPLASQTLEPHSLAYASLFTVPAALCALPSLSTVGAGQIPALRVLGHSSSITPDLCCLLSQAFRTFRYGTGPSLKPARKPNVCSAAAWFPFLGFTSWVPCRGRDVLFRSGMLRVLRDRWLRFHRRSCR